jgi:hypothetical protein
LIAGEAASPGIAGAAAPVCGGIFCGYDSENKERRGAREAACG